jgi:5-methylcytosine-specific restriction endonuclease McrA
LTSTPPAVSVTESADPAEVFPFETASVLNTKVLVLNRAYLPIHITSVRRACSLLYQGVARAVDEQYQTFDFESWAALSASLQKTENIGLIDRAMRVPRVILLVAYDRVPKRHVRFSRFNVYARDRNTCQYCGLSFSRSELNLDHVVPRAQGGTSTWENVVCSCLRCNRQKGGRSPDEAGMNLLRRPMRPNWTPFVLETWSLRRHREWLPFLSTVDAAYWNTELVDR